MNWGNRLMILLAVSIGLNLVLAGMMVGSRLARSDMHHGDHACFDLPFALSPVTVGLADTIVVDTPDVVLVCAADRAQEVRTIVDRLTQAKETDYL